MGGNDKLHIFFFPFMPPGHVIPMTDMAKLFAMRGAKSTILATQVNAALITSAVESTCNLGFDINIIVIKLPVEEVGLPADFHDLNSLRSPEMHQKFHKALWMLDRPLETLLQEHRPDCLIADMCLPGSTAVAAKFDVPKLVFHGAGYFPLSAVYSITHHRPYENVSSDSEPFLIPNFPGDIKITRAQLPDSREETELMKFLEEVHKSDLMSYGVVVNSFYELEPAHADHYKNVLGRRAWGIGPLLMCNDGIEDKLARGKGNHALAVRHECLKWLDSNEPNSVIYICFGSLTSFSPSQLHDIAMGLEASGHQFVWVVNKDENVEDDAEEWLPKGYEERMKEKGLIARGWVPQAAILEHNAIGSFVTHCGWNSILEGISNGVSMVTWPVAAEQFYNEKLVTEVLKIGIPVGAKKWATLVGDRVKSEMVEKAVKEVMEGEAAAEMRRKVGKLSEMARKAVEEGGSSYSDMTSLLEELRSERTIRISREEVRFVVDNSVCISVYLRDIPLLSI